MIPLSILDLAPVAEGGDTAQALHHCLDLARHADAWGYARYWLAEHHNMSGVACSATVVLIGHVAGGTQRIRVGSGGIMLPNHAPLVVAEQFGTLATLYPGRIDLGLGRAPGTDQPTMRALRQGMARGEDSFVDDIAELKRYFGPDQPGQMVRAIPGRGTEVPMWILGSSLYGAQVAAHYGLPFAFASHFAPDQLDPALAIYRERFKPSPEWAVPHVMVAANVLVAETDEEAAHLFTSLQQRFLGLVTGRRGVLPRPVESMDALWSPAERAQVERMLSVSAVGRPATVAQRLSQIIERTGANELIVTTSAHDPAKRLRSYELLAGIAASQ
ncbi:MAG: LLM class flavin-dependent oxidoreductase [Burkholderiales bacterium]